MLAYLFVVLAIAVRFMPHPWMFTPVTASLLFFGARGPRRFLWAPVAMLAASDIVLTKYFWHYRKFSVKGVGQECPTHTSIFDPHPHHPLDALPS